MKVRTSFSSWIALTLIHHCILKTSQQATPSTECLHQECGMELLLGNFRNVAETDLPKVSADEVLQDCRKETEEKRKEFITSIQTIVKNSNETRNRMEEVVLKIRNDQSKFGKIFDDKSKENRELQRNMGASDSLINRKFDCNVNLHTVSECKNFCTFPYSFNTCEDSGVKAEFVKRLIATKIGICCFTTNTCCLKRFYTNPSNSKSTCFEVHIITN